MCWHRICWEVGHLACGSIGLLATGLVQFAAIKARLGSVLQSITLCHVSIEDGLLDRISLSEGIVDVGQLVAPRHLIVGVEGISLPQGHWGLLEGIRLATNDIRCNIGLLVLSALASVKAPIALGSARTSEDVVCL